MGSRSPPKTRECLYKFSEKHKKKDEKVFGVLSGPPSEPARIHSDAPAAVGSSRISPIAGRACKDPDSKRRSYRRFHCKIGIMNAHSGLLCRRT